MPCSHAISKCGSAFVSPRATSSTQPQVNTAVRPSTHARVSAIVARSEILGFEQREDRRWTIRLAPKLILVHPKAKRAHQGWRYLTEKQAPADLAEGEVQSDAMPGRLIRKLSALGLA